MKRQFDWLFKAKKVIALRVFPQAQICKPCFRNIDFQARLSISRKGRAPLYMQVKFVDNVYGSLLIPTKKNNRDKTELL